MISSSDTISRATPYRIRRLLMIRLVQTDWAELRHRNTLTLCMTMLALRQAVVALRYTGSVGAKGDLRPNLRVRSAIKDSA